MKRLALLLVGASLAACAPGRPYIYRPSSVSLVDEHGQPAAVYAVPPERPEGEVRLYSQGLVEIEPTPGAPKSLALHARFIVVNNGDATPFMLDTREVTVEIPGEGSAAALYANSDVGAMPAVAVARGERRVVDFYFPVPGPVTGADRLGEFDLRWQIQTSARLVAQRTPFQRLELQPAQPEPQVAFIAAAPFWWFHPHYHAAHLFVHRPVVVVPVAPHRVVVRPHGRRSSR